MHRPVLHDIVVRDAPNRDGEAEDVEPGQHVLAEQQNGHRNGGDLFEYAAYGQRQPAIHQIDRCGACTHAEVCVTRKYSLITSPNANMPPSAAKPVNA